MNREHIEMLKRTSESLHADSPVLSKTAVELADALLVAQDRAEAADALLVAVDNWSALSLPISTKFVPGASTRAEIEEAGTKMRAAREAYRALAVQA